MSTQPGKSKGGSDKGAETAKPKKTVAASAKPARDEATVEITPVVSDATTPDLEAVKDTDLDPAEDKAIAPVKDQRDRPAKEQPAKAAAPKPAAPKGAAAPKAATPKEPAKETAKKDWTKPAEPGGSVSTGRTDTPFPREPAASPAAAAGTPAAGPAPAAAGNGAGGFAGTVLKDRPAANTTKPGAKTPAAGGKPARKAQLQLARLEPWSVMKFSFVMSLVCFVVLLVAVIVLWSILSGLGVFSAISDTVNELTKQQGQTEGGLDAGSWFSFTRVLGYTVLVGALNVLLVTALSTVGSVIYNLAADLVGGVEVTLKEAE
ncbi:DUF3566 domain-containing protein [Spirillospora sp. NPDC127200]